MPYGRYSVWNSKLYCDGMLCLVEILFSKNSAALELCQSELETMLAFEEKVFGLRFTYMKTLLLNEHRVYMNSQVREVYCM